MIIACLITGFTIGALVIMAIAVIVEDLHK